MVTLPAGSEAATFSSISLRRPVMSTLAPSATKRSTTPAPMPVPPPVTKCDLAF